MKVTIFEYRLVDIEIDLKEAIRDNRLLLHAYHVSNKNSFAYKYFPADFGDTFVVVYQDYHDGGESIVGLLAIPSDLPSFTPRAVKEYVLENLDGFISSDYLEDWL